ncbi:MAG: hypothetical protein JWM10_4547 [Myxococcaceae bacterium]|nr:hypothetical protein [Myxococcaceae bacterium]
MTAAPETDEPEETEAERIERDYDELLEEIRIALPGAEVMLGFLLTVPFTERFSALGDGQKAIYLASLLCVAAATALLLAPTAWHRIRFKKGDKPWITRRGTALVLAAMVVMIPGIAGTLFVVTDVILSRAAALVVAATTALLVPALWFGVPLARHRD